MAISNIERFDQASGLIFAHLYFHFPQRTMLTSGLLEPIFKDLDESDSDWLSKFASKEAFFNSTMSWLIEAGFIWCKGTEQTIQTIYSHCVLTTKALEAMKSVPSTLTGESLGNSLAESARSGALDAAKGLANDVFTKGLSWATSAAMSAMSQSV